LFEEGTEPTESCDVHFEGDLCDYDHLPASPECPFKVHGIVSLPLVEDPVLLNGSTTIVENEDGTQSVITPATTNTCQHNADFFANPDYESILAAQQNEINQRNAAAAMAQMEGQ
jgi:penicillin-binding protein 1A